MASERRTCPKPKGCGRKFSRPLGSRRLYCETCSPPRKPPVSERPALVPPHGDGPGPIEAQALEQLTAARRVDTIAGQALLAAAREADSGRVTGSGLGTLLEKLLRLADVALAGIQQARDPDALDELTARRQEKAREAS